MIEDVARLRLTVDSTGITQARTKLNSLGNAGSSVTKKIAGELQHQELPLEHWQ